MDATPNDPQACARLEWSSNDCEVIIMPTKTGQENREHAETRRILLLCGILSSLLYLAMNIAVPFFYEGYSFAAHTISELSAVGAPTRTLWVVPAAVYTLLVTAFGWGVRTSAGQDRRMRIVGGLMIVYGLSGIAWFSAPMHQREVLAAGGGTIEDTMHIALSGVTSVIYLSALAFGASAFGKTFRVYTFVTMALLIAFGALLGMDGPKISLNEPTPWVGVTERIMLGVVILWIAVLSGALLRRQRAQREV
jgi:hypothetical protein